MGLMTNSRLGLPLQMQDVCNSIAFEEDYMKN
jgi:hypothetical protein